MNVKQGVLKDFRESYKRASLFFGHTDTGSSFLMVRIALFDPEN